MINVCNDATPTRFDCKRTGRAALRPFARRAFLAAGPAFAARSRGSAFSRVAVATFHFRAAVCVPRCDTRTDARRRVRTLLPRTQRHFRRWRCRLPPANARRCRLLTRSCLVLPAWFWMVLRGFRAYDARRYYNAASPPRFSPRCCIPFFLPPVRARRCHAPLLALAL